MNGKRIADARKAKGWSQERLGKAIGCSQQAIAKYESPKGDMPTEVLLSLSNALGVTVSYLLGMDGGPLYDDSDPALAEIVDTYHAVTGTGRQLMLANARGVAQTYRKTDAEARVGRSA